MANPHIIRKLMSLRLRESRHYLQANATCVVRPGGPLQVQSASSKTRRIGTVASIIAAAVGVTSLGAMQSATPAEIATRLTGKWKLNVALTPASEKPARGRGDVQRAPSLAISGPALQRGGGRGGGASGGGGGQPGSDSAPLMPEEIAAQAALTILHEVPLEIAIEAHVDSVTFRDPRGEWHFNVDGKNATMAVPGGTLHTKSKWDKGVLRQEFSSTRRKLIKVWSIDAPDRLLLTERVESFAPTSESKAVFDRVAPSTPR
jgi:hypothetical protein